METIVASAIPIAVPAIVFCFLAAIIIVPMVLRFRHRQALMELVRAAASRGEPLSPEIIDKLAIDRPSPPKNPIESDLRSGSLLIAVALALVVFSFGIVAIEGDRDAYALAVIAAFPGFVGLTKIMFGVVGLRRRGG